MKKNDIFMCFCDFLLKNTLAGLSGIENGDARQRNYLLKIYMRFLLKVNFSVKILAYVQKK